MAGKDSSKRWAVCLPVVFVNMDETELRACKISEKKWQCPVSSCSQVLSRKQTLQSHLLCNHEIKAGNPQKRYKLYESDPTIPIPRRTQNALLQKEREVASLELTHQREDVSAASRKEGVVGHGHQQNTCTELESMPTLGNSEVLDKELEIELESIITSDNNVLDMDIQTDSEDGGMQTDNEGFISSSDEESPPTAKSDNSDPPLYVVPSSPELFSSSITTSQHILAVSAFATRHNFSDTAIKDLLHLIQLHIPKNNTGETNINEMKDKCGFDRNYLKYHLYCDSCKKLFSDEADDCKTPGCEGSKTDSQSRKYFVTSDLKRQVREILERKGLWQSIQDSREICKSQVISDVRSSEGYKELEKPGGFLHDSTNITMSLFTDGVPLFKSSGVSIWPVYLLINEIPPGERFLRKNMLLWGIWQGNGKPKMNMFLRPLVIDLIDLYENGTTLTVQNEKFTTKAMLVVATMDLQARAYLTNMTQHNGEFGCIYCMESGVIVPSGKAHCRSYPVREQPAALRTEQDVQQSARQARQTGRRTQGFLGESVLSYLPYFAMTQTIVIDYMHGILLGITKKLLELWFDAKHKDTEHYIGKEMTQIDKLLKKIRPPYIVHRLPRVLSNTYNHWKASELRNWLLFYSVPCLQGILPDVYLKHWSCLVEATYILLGEGITPTDLRRAEVLLKAYVTNMPLLYGENYLSLNVHNLTHLVNVVRRWGPLWTFSCFSFESFNGEIKKSVHGTGNVCRQVFWTFQAQKRIAQNAVNVQEGEVKDFLLNMLDGRDKKSHGTDAYQCKIIKLLPLKAALSDDVTQQLKELVDFTHESELMAATKIMRNGFTMYSSNCTKVKTHNSYTIVLERQTDDENEVAIEADMYLMHKESRRVFAIGRTLTSQGGVMEHHVPHIFQMKYSEKMRVVPAELLQEPLMVINRRGGMFGAYLPNHFERD